MVDVTDSKSVGGDIVWVRVPPPAPKSGYPFRGGRFLHSVGLEQVGTRPQAGAKNIRWMFFRPRESPTTGKKSKQHPQSGMLFCILYLSLTGYPHTGRPRDRLRRRHPFLQHRQRPHSGGGGDLLHHPRSGGDDPHRRKSPQAGPLGCGQLRSVRPTERLLRYRRHHSTM